MQHFCFVFGTFIRCTKELGQIVQLKFAQACGLRHHRQCSSCALLYYCLVFSHQSELELSDLDLDLGLYFCNENTQLRWIAT